MKHLTLGSLLLLVLCACQYGNIPITYTYGQGKTTKGFIDLNLDFYIPSETCTTPRPTVVYIHEGSFYQGGKSLGRPYANAFLDAGFNFASVDYRKAWQRPIPNPIYASAAQSMRQRAERIPPIIIDSAISALEDAVGAFEFMQDNQSTLCHDANRVVVMGTSAGAVIGLNLAYALDNYGISRAPLRGVISNCGGYLDTGAMRAGDVPLIHFHSMDDDVIVFEEAKLIQDAAARTRTPMQLYTFENLGHCPDLLEAEVDDTSLLNLSIEFVERVTSGKAIRTLERYQ